MPFAVLLWGAGGMKKDGTQIINIIIMIYLVNRHQGPIAANNKEKELRVGGNESEMQN